MYLRCKRNLFILPVPFKEHRKKPFRWASLISRPAGTCASPKIHGKISSRLFTNNGDNVLKLSVLKLLNCSAPSWNFRKCAQVRNCNGTINCASRLLWINSTAKHKSLVLHSIYRTYSNASSSVIRLAGTKASLYSKMAFYSCRVSNCNITILTRVSVPYYWSRWNPLCTLPNLLLSSKHTTPLRSLPH